MDSRANACRAIGILRGDAALPDLVEALRTKDNNVMYEALAAMQKIRDPPPGPKITYLLRDLDDRVQTTAIETAGILRSHGRAADAARHCNESAQQEGRARRAVRDRHDARARWIAICFCASWARRTTGSGPRRPKGWAASETRPTSPRSTKLWQDEEKMLPRLGAAFALVMDGKLELAEDSPFRYLINTLNSASYHDVAYAYLVEAARRKPVLQALYGLIAPGTRDEKIYLARILSVSGDADSVPYLDKISQDAGQ